MSTALESGNAVSFQSTFTTSYSLLQFVTIFISFLISSCLLALHFYNNNNDDDDDDDDDAQICNSCVAGSV